MKKCFTFAAIAALVLAASCSKTELRTPYGDTQKAIGFTNYAPRSLSKASASLVNTGSLPADSQIGVYGYSTGEPRFSTTAIPAWLPSFMTNLPVIYSGNTSATATATDPVRYWPKSTINLLTFYGYYPYNDATITSKPGASDAALGTFGFTQTSDVTTMVDFMVSDVANDYYYDATSASNSNGIRSEDGSVPLTLRHMLTKVNFKFKQASGITNTEIKVTSASIAGVLASGSLTPTYDLGAAGSLGTTTFPTTWATAGTAYSGSVDIPINSVVSSADAAYIVLTTDAVLNCVKNDGAITGQNFLFVPQTLSDAVVVTINYDITQNGNVTHNTSTVQLNTGGNPTAWNRNNNIVYTFTIGLQPIKFTATVVDWDSESNGAFAI